jgi:multidrug efflux pump subunit AcrB
MKLGLSGVLTRTFIASPLTPLFLLAALVLGALALLALPREEEPQISVPMVDILIQANGLKAEDAAQLVTKPLEDIVKAIKEVEYVYSQTSDDRVVVTARFYVGTREDDAILRVHEKIRANFDRLPVGIPEPLIVARGINDVPVLVLTLTPRHDLPDEIAARWDDNALHKIAADLQHELVAIDDVGTSFLVGGRPDEIRIEPDTEALALYGVTLEQLVEKIRNANRSFVVGRIRESDTSIDLLAGQTLTGQPDIGLLLVTTRDGRPVYVKDVARIVVGARQDEHRVWDLRPDGQGGLSRRPAVSIAFAKREGANAVVVTEAMLHRLELMQGRLVPPEVEVRVTRNFGETAKEKADELLFHLALATVSIVALIVVFIGWREGIVTAVIIPATILLTFFASWLMGYTINRVSLFALIFSIGILVDDAIVVVENIVRHWRMEPEAPRLETAVRAVAEVGNPTIVATLTIIAALLPMMFVSGLMGPYMSPIPANASAAMLFSFFVAVVIAPWLLVKVGGARHAAAAARGHGHGEDAMGRFYRRVAGPILRSRWRAFLFLLVVGIATLASLALFYTRHVTVKLLPFDNKSELQVIVDLPEGSSLEATQRMLLEIADTLADLPELASIQAHAGTAAPFNFNGLVRHYYLRANPEFGDLQVELVPKAQRSRASHAIALDVRDRIGRLTLTPGTVVKVAEVPPGPPVLATLLAEVYGPDAATRRETASRIREAFAAVPFVVDIDDSFGAPTRRLRLSIDQAQLDFHGVEQQAVYDTIQALFGGVVVGYSHRGGGADPVEIAIRLPEAERRPLESILATPVPARGSAGIATGNVELGDVVTAAYEPASFPLFRKNGVFIEMILAELAGTFEAPVYGMLAVQDEIARMDWGPAGPPEIRLHGAPADTGARTLVWDGEWEITWITFRDMGAAFGAAILGIYLLVVAQFRSFKLPLVILTPVPLTLIGIMLGHWLLGAHFTATSMIGFISLAGIIVRNSILLVDFIRHERDHYPTLREALLAAGAIRFKPIFLTAAAAMIGAAFILADPIFQGLAISLLFGLASSTALTLLVVPAIYVVMRGGARAA